MALSTSASRCSGADRPLLNWVMLLVRARACWFACTRGAQILLPLTWMADRLVLRALAWVFRLCRSVSRLACAPPENRIKPRKAARKRLNSLKIEWLMRVGSVVWLQTHVFHHGDGGVLGGLQIGQGQLQIALLDVLRVDNAP